MIAGALILLVFTGLFEEFIFRGLIQGVSINFLGPLGGVVFAALIFSVLHIGWHSILDLLFALGVGVYFSLIVLRTTSLWGVTVAHGAISTMVFIVVPLLLVPIAVSSVASAPTERIPSGSTVTLHWRYSPLAKDYRLQVAHCSQGCINALKKIGETSSPPSYMWQKHEIHGFVTYKIHGIVTFKPKVFHVHVTTAILKGTRVTIPVIGKQWYYSARSVERVRQVGAVRAARTAQGN